MDTSNIVQFICNEYKVDHRDVTATPLTNDGALTVDGDFKIQEFLVKYEPEYDKRLPWEAVVTLKIERTITK